MVAYGQQEWHDDDLATPLSAARLTHQEAGIAEADTVARVALARAPAVVSPSQYGAVSVAVDGNGFPTSPTPADSTTAVLASLAALKPGDTWLIDGNYCYQNVRLDLAADGVTVKRANSGRLISTTTHATADPDGKFSAIRVLGHGCSTVELVIRVANVTVRRGTYDNDGGLVVRGDRFMGRGINIDGGWQIGIVLFGTRSSRIFNPVVKNTAADGYHFLGGCDDTKVVTGVSADTGDDGFGVTDYPDSPPNTSCGLVNCTVNNSGARGIAVQGGTFTVEDCTVNGSQGAGLFVSGENGGGAAGVTKAVRNVRFSRVALNDTNRNGAIQHGPMFVVNYRPEEGAVDGVHFEDINVGALPAGGFNGGIGILSTYGTVPRNVTFDRITLHPSRAAQVFLFNDIPDSSYRLTDSKTSTGTAIPDAGTAGAGTGGPPAPGSITLGQLNPAVQAVIGQAVPITGTDHGDGTGTLTFTISGKVFTVAPNGAVTVDGDDNPPPEADSLVSFVNPAALPGVDGDVVTTVPDVVTTDPVAALADGDDGGGFLSRLRAPGPGAYVELLRTRLWQQRTDLNPAAGGYSVTAKLKEAGPFGGEADGQQWPIIALSPDGARGSEITDGARALIVAVNGAGVVSMFWRTWPGGTLTDTVIPDLGGLTAPTGGNGRIPGPFVVTLVAKAAGSIRINGVPVLTGLDFTGGHHGNIVFGGNTQEAGVIRGQVHYMGHRVELAPSDADIIAAEAAFA